VLVVRYGQPRFFLRSSRKWSEEHQQSRPTPVSWPPSTFELGLVKRHTADLWLVRSNIIGHLQQMKDVRLDCELVIRTPSCLAIAALFKDKLPFREPLGSVEFRKLRRGLSGRES
jgi:hypothetical protein